MTIVRLLGTCGRRLRGHALKYRAGRPAGDLFERLVAASGLRPIRLHDLRHGAATLMLAAAIDIKIVSDTLGHSDTPITRDIYQSVLPHVGKSAAEATAKPVPLQRKAEAEAEEARQNPRSADI